jgi:thiol-disulfide isomerase/thioredoxin
MFEKKSKSQHLVVLSITLLIAIFVSSIISIPPSVAASSNQKIVLAELFTSTWCGFCPYATQAINKLADEYGPSQLLILQYHPSGSDPFGNAEIDTRIAYYGIPGYPTMIFDGNIFDVGGSNSTYNSYDGIIENELTKSSEVAISLKGNLQDITAEITGSNLMSQLSAKVQFVLYEKDIPFDAPNGEKTFTFTVRKILNEEHISLNAGQKTSIRRTFQPQPEWNIKKMGLVVFVQNDDTDEILQAATFPLFSFISEETTKNIQTNEIANYTAILMNSGDFDDIYEITSMKSLPVGWEAGFCLGNMCYWDSALVSLEANSLQVVEIFIVSGNVSGTASINFTITSELNPAHTSSIIFIANVESSPNNHSSNPLQFILEQPWILLLVVICVIAIIGIAFVLRKRRK